MQRSETTITLTNLITRLKLILILSLVGVGLILLLENSTYLHGQQQDYARIVCPTLPSTDESTNADLKENKYTEDDVTIICKTLYGESRGLSDEEQALVVWCILNRVDARDSTIEEVVTAPGQFYGYDEDNPVLDSIREITLSVLEAWSRGEEAWTLEPYATTSEYQYFAGDGEHNWFREEY